MVQAASPANPDLDFNPVRNGLFYSLRLGGTWVAADWWLHYFQIDHNIAAYVNHLVDDLNAMCCPYYPAVDGSSLPGKCRGACVQAPSFTPMTRRIAATRDGRPGRQLNLEHNDNLTE